MNNVSALAPSLIAPSGASSPASTPPVASTTNSFSQMVEQTLKNTEFASGFNHHLTEAQGRMLSGGHFSPRELLLLQVQLGRFNLQVEMVSKVAEAATSTIKRMQNG